MVDATGIELTGRISWHGSGADDPKHANWQPTKRCELRSKTN